MSMVFKSETSAVDIGSVEPPVQPIVEIKHRGRPLGSKNLTSDKRSNHPKQNVSEQLLSSQERWAFFVRSWQESNSCEEVARLAGLTVMTCRSKASVLRNKGVRLKKMPIGQSFSVEELNKLIDVIDESKLTSEFESMKYALK